MTNYLDNLSKDKLVSLYKMDFRYKEGKELKEKIGIKSTKIIKEKIKYLLNKQKRVKIKKIELKSEPELPLVVKVQSIVRRYLFILRLNYFGPAYYNQKISNNSFDFFSYQDINLIPLEFLFSYKDIDNFVYTFDIRSLDKLFSSGSKENPFNRQLLPQRVIEIVQKRIHQLKNETLKKKRNLQDSVISLKKKKCNSSEEMIAIKTRAVDIFQRMDQLDQYTNVSWFCDLNLKQLKNFYRFLEDIWNYRTQISSEQKKRISKNGDVCAIPVYKILRIKKITELQTIILDQIELLVTGGETREEQILGCLYVLTAFAETSPKIAECLPWLINS